MRRRRPLARRPVGAEAGGTVSGSPPIRRAAVALAAPTLAHQWVRQESAPHGAIVVADREIAARGRGGIEWLEDHAIACSLILRPRDLLPSAADVAWLLAGLAGAATIDRLAASGEKAHGEATLWWPDRIIDGPASPPEQTPTAIGLHADTVLEPGRVSYSVVTVRFGWPAALDNERRDDALSIAVDELAALAGGLDERGELVARYRRRCASLGRRVTVHRIPHGSARGIARDVTDDGALLLESSTGLQEVVTVAAIRTVEPVGDGPVR